MPSEVSPRILLLDLAPVGQHGPASATGTCIPACTFGAPQTMRRAAAASTTQSDELVRFGMPADFEHLADDDVG